MQTKIKKQPPIPRRQKKNSDLKKLFDRSIVAQNPCGVNASTASDRLSVALHEKDLTSAIEALEAAGYHDDLTQVFLLGWLAPSQRREVSSEK